MPPRVTFRRVVASLRGRGRSPVLPFACCVGSLRSVGRCGRCSRWCRFRVRRAPSLVCWGCAGCGGMCRLRVSGAQSLAYWGLCWLLQGSFDCFCCPHTSVLRSSIACVSVFPCACAPPPPAPHVRHAIGMAAGSWGLLYIESGQPLEAARRQRWCGTVVCLELWAVRLVHNIRLPGARTWTGLNGIPLGTATGSPRGSGLATGAQVHRRSGGSGHVHGRCSGGGCSAHLSAKCSSAKPSGRPPAATSHSAIKQLPEHITPPLTPLTHNYNPPHTHTYNPPPPHTHTYNPPPHTHL